MTQSLPPCPECSSTYAYQVDALLVCPECGHEWSQDAGSEPADEVRDSEVRSPLAGLISTLRGCRPGWTAA